MQYETILLELMSRIQTLENEVSSIKEKLQTLQPPTDAAKDTSADQALSSPAHSNASYTKMTEHMMDVCYAYGQKAYRDPRANLAGFAAAAASETGMNRNSAFMYICAVKNLLEGRVFKRAISTKALRRYFSSIYRDFGAAGLSNAITAARAHIEYRQRYHLPVDSIIALCDEFAGELQV